MAAIGFIGSFDRGVEATPLSSRERPTLHWAAASDPGLGQRHNEDAWKVCESSGLILLADGSGGFNAGSVASALAIDETASALATDLDLPPASPARMSALERAVQAANAAILATAARRPECLGMGSTLSLVWVDVRVMTIGHVGDSRIYLWRGGRLLKVTRDHLLRHPSAALGDEPAGPPRELLSRVLGGMPRVDVDVAQIDWLHGDRLLVCSDGLTDVVGEGFIAECLANILAPGDCADALVAAALANGGQDNVTAIAACVSRGQ